MAFNSYMPAELPERERRGTPSSSVGPERGQADKGFQLKPT